MEILSPYKIKEVTFQRNYPGYLYRRELVDDSEHGGDGKLPMVNCYSADSGHWIGGARTARMLCKKFGLRNIQKIKDSHCVCSIGLNESEQKWYGWSHRAIFGFGIGSTCKKGDCGYMPSDFSELSESCHCLDTDNLCTANCTVELREVMQEPSVPDGPEVANQCLETVPGTETPPVPCELSNCVFELGKGAWTAKTMEDAKQMAIDFSEGVS